MIATYGYSMTETIIAWISAPLVIAAIILWASGAVRGFLNAVRNRTPTSAIENVNALHVDEVHLHRDPTRPHDNYAAVSEVREHVRRGRR